jgi:hypothetical protein
LRDDLTAKIDAKRVADLFGIKMPAIARAAGLSRQAIDENPLSDKAQPVLKLFERAARLRVNPRFREPADLRKWFKRPLPVFSNHSAEKRSKRGNSMR